MWRTGGGVRLPHRVEIWRRVAGEIARMKWNSESEERVSTLTQVVMGDYA